MLNEKNTIRPVSWVWSNDLFYSLFVKLFLICGFIEKLYMKTVNIHWLRKEKKQKRSSSEMQRILQGEELITAKQAF